MIRFVPVAAALAIATGGTTSPTPDRCTAPRDDSASPDLYCIDLVAAPGLGSTSGHVILDFVPGPFTVSVTRDGHQRYRPTIVLTGLPDPRVVDTTATTYVAWVTTPRYAEFINLGPVANGATILPPVDFDQFIIVVSAERAVDVSERSGRLVLRGGSPSTRLQPPDMQQFALALASPGHLMADHVHDSVVPAGGDVRWTTVPMPQGLAMLPSEMALRPPVGAFLPTARDASPLRGTTVLRVRTGDTLSLVAGRVTRRIHGREYTMYAFNGQSPGPVLDVSRGARVTVLFRNDLDMPTTVHWHGLRLDAAMDGVPHLSQEPVPPGGRFTYQLVFPDAGVYWYHPHVREATQLDLGLAGNIRVRDGGGGVREELVMLDDILIGADGLVPFGSDTATHALMGRFGNVFLTNGEPRWQARARGGETVRYWFTNAANTRTFNLSFTNATMELVATDLGPFERPVPVESVVIAPAERYAVDVTFRGGDGVLENRVRALDHLFGRFFSEVDTLAVVAVTSRGRVGPTAGVAPPAVRRVERLAEVTLGGEPDLTLAFGVRMSGLPYVTSRMLLLDSAYFHPVEWSGTMVGMNWATTAAQAHWFVRDMATGRENEAIDLRVRQGDRRRIRLVNQRGSAHGMHHPIHLHGQRFLIVSVNGVAPTVRGWKDTILLPAGSVADILVEFDNPGRWMLHCHIAEHVESGMMTTLTVEPR